MKRIFVDTSFLIAYHHAGDALHANARSLMEEGLLEYFPFRLVITDYVFDEVVTILRRKASTEKAAQIGASLLNQADFELHWISDRYFGEAWSVFRRFRDKSWSFTDCTSYVWIEQNRPDFCLAMDQDFDQFGLAPNLVRRQT